MSRSQSLSPSEICVQSLGRNDSKIVARTCQGINLYNGQACRNQVATSRVIRLCHKHQDQANTHSSLKLHSTNSITSGSQSESHSKGRTPGLTRSVVSDNKNMIQSSIQVPPCRRGGVICVKTTPGVVKSIPASQTEHLFELPVQASDQSLHLSDRATAPVPGLPCDDKPTSARPGTWDSKYDRDRSGHFNFADLLRALGCIPPGKHKESANCGKEIPCKVGETTYYGREAISQESAKTPGSVACERLAPTQTRPYGVSRSMDQIRGESRPHTRNVDYFVQKYAPVEEYIHKTGANHRQMINAIKDIAIKASRSTDIQRSIEYIYVFRHDGDYVYTPTISLKIGRTSKNVDTRLRQWYLQCRQRVDRLDEFETQHAMIVERMLHLEFKEDRVLKQCRCGRTHKEWFELQRDGAKSKITRMHVARENMDWN